MRVELGLNQGSLRRWQIEAARRLGEIRGVAIGTRWAKPQGDPVPSCVGTLLKLEESLHGSVARLWSRAEPTDLSSYVGTGGASPDLVIDLGGGTPSAGRRRWRLTFDGGVGDAPIVAALLEGRAPIIAVCDTADGAVIANARPGLDPDLGVAAGLECVLARAVDLIVVAVRAGGTPLRVRPAPSRVACSQVVGRSIATLAEAARARLTFATQRPHRTVTGWRFVAGADVIDLGSHPTGGWRILADDGRRSYAHPFPIVTRAQSWLFVTERNQRLGKSMISAVRFGTHGPLGTPVPVLETSSDLSYPNVFEADGTIWMIPQKVGGDSIDLYRATRFPGGWRHEASLVTGIDARGATPFRHRGRWWMTATVADGGPVADMLYLWSADDIRGPWRPHPANPVLIDASGAWAAGRIVERHGRLIRPIRDLTPGGRGLALAEIIRLDDDSFEQRIVAEIGSGPGWPGFEVSTLNRAGTIECIDGPEFAMRRPTSLDLRGRTGHPPFPLRPRAAGALGPAIPSVAPR